MVKSMVGPSFGDVFTRNYFNTLCKEIAQEYPVKYLIHAMRSFMKVDTNDWRAEANLKYLNDPVTNRVAGQVGNGMQIEFAH
jgi:hypothetical protein